MLLRSAAVLAALAAGPACAQDFPEDITYDSYIVDGSTLAEVADDMAANGPRGFWAYTTWQVNWTDSCDVSIEGRITLPELAEDSELSDDDVATFDTMLEALTLHEEGHIDFARGFAADAANAGCDPADDVLEDWLQRERDYDAETDHGRTQGVTLQ